MFKSHSSRWLVGACVLVASFLSASTTADEIWVAPTLQADLGGLGVSSSGIWPVTPFGAARFAMGVPDDLQVFQQANVVIIPEVSGAGVLTVIVCGALDGEIVAVNCAAAVNVPFNGVADELNEVDISTAVAPHVGVPGETNLAVLAFTAPATATDHIVGMRFRYQGTTTSKASIYLRTAQNGSCNAGFNCFAEATCDDLSDIAISGRCFLSCSDDACRQGNPWLVQGALRNHQDFNFSSYQCGIHNVAGAPLPNSISSDVHCLALP